MTHNKNYSKKIVVTVNGTGYNSAKIDSLVSELHSVMSRSNDVENYHYNGPGAPYVKGHQSLWKNSLKKSFLDGFRRFSDFITGWTVDSAARDIADRLFTQILINPDAPVSITLIGWSRGAVINIKAMELLQKRIDALKTDPKQSVLYQKLTNQLPKGDKRNIKPKIGLVLIDPVLGKGPGYTLKLPTIVEKALLFTPQDEKRTMMAPVVIESSGQQLTYIPTPGTHAMPVTPRPPYTNVRDVVLTEMVNFLGDFGVEVPVEEMPNVVAVESENKKSTSFVLTTGHKVMTPEELVEVYCSWRQDYQRKRRGMTYSGKDEKALKNFTVSSRFFKHPAHERAFAKAYPDLYHYIFKDAEYSAETSKKVKAQLKELSQYPNSKQAFIEYIDTSNKARIKLSMFETRRYDSFDDADKPSHSTAKSVTNKPNSTPAAKEPAVGYSKPEFKRFQMIWMINNTQNNFCAGAMNVLKAYCNDESVGGYLRHHFFHSRHHRATFNELIERVKFKDNPVEFIAEVDKTLNSNTLFFNKKGAGYKTLQFIQMKFKEYEKLKELAANEQTEYETAIKFEVS